ncbi:MAG: hypothetical protein IT353_11750 [Gemmatimonadaceae bacterium]|nr:hypothetical protein [Gemmatimonadaceae bacterium]
MDNDQRVYTDEEFALILRSASEMSNSADVPARHAGGLTLHEMKSAAAQAGFDPALVERAARQLLTSANTSPFERLVGGSLQHEQSTHLTLTLDDTTATRLLSIVRLSAVPFRSAEPGHASAMGVQWDAAGDGDVFSVIATPTAHGTSLSVTVDRRGTLALTGVVSLLAVIAALLAAGTLGEVSPLLGVGTGVAGVGGTLTAARAFWASSTKKTRDRIAAFFDTVDRTLSAHDAQRPPARFPLKDTEGEG